MEGGTSSVVTVWYSHNFSIPKERARLKQLWEDTLELTKVGDMLLGDQLWPREDLENWIRRHEGLKWRHRDGEDWIVK